MNGDLKGQVYRNKVIRYFYFFSMNTHLSTKIYNFLVNAEEEHITGASVIYQGIEDDPWVSKDELRSIISQAVTLANSQNIRSSSRHTTLLEILSEVS